MQANLALRLVDVLSRKTVLTRYHFLRESQWWSREALRELQLAKLRRLLVHCAVNVPFYRDVMRAKHIDPSRVTSLEVLDEFPVIDKGTVKAEIGAFRSRSTHGLGLLRYTQTGGTTGEPLRFPKDSNVRSAAQAAMLLFHDWMGIGTRDPKLVVWGAPIVPRGVARRARTWMLAQLFNVREVNSFTLSREQLPDVLGLLRRWKPKLIHGYCLTLVELARWMAEAGHTYAARAVSTTVEPLFDADRVTLQAAFTCAAFDQYGCGEVEAIAMECEAHQGLHVTEERVILELSASGEVILTDLDNLAFPFIRYRNGDVAEAAAQKCLCGRESRVLRRILGRSGDIVIGLNGRRLHPEFFTHLINESGIGGRRELRRYQVVQESANRIVWRMVCQPLLAEEERRLSEILREYLGPMDIRVENVEQISASASGKYRYVVNMT